MAVLDETGRVRAAGGVVLRAGAGGEELLVVHRPDRDDWSLPKGKVDPGEDDEACARREVEEETGLRCAVGGPAGEVEYVDSRGRPKVVRYWYMTAEGDPRIPDGDEVDDVRWVSLRDAPALLTYPHDRALVRRVLTDRG